MQKGTYMLSWKMQKVAEFDLLDVLANKQLISSLES